MQNKYRLSARAHPWYVSIKCGKLSCKRRQQQCRSKSRWLNNGRSRCFAFLSIVPKGRISWMHSLISVYLAQHAVNSSAYMYMQCEQQFNGNGHLATKEIDQHEAEIKERTTVATNRMMIEWLKRSNPTITRNDATPEKLMAEKVLQ